jgi:hypothetical protein
MSAARHTISNGGAVLNVDSAPNTIAPPPERIFTIPKSPTGIQGIWLGAENGTPDCELWCKVTPNKWLALSTASFGGGTTFSLSSDAAIPLTIGLAIVDVPCFVRVMVPNGATAIHVGTSNT